MFINNKKLNSNILKSSINFYIVQYYLNLSHMHITYVWVYIITYQLHTVLITMTNVNKFISLYIIIKLISWKLICKIFKDVKFNNIYFFNPH